ncbi:MAG TPA: DUF4262 domain-containing protein [Terracidiphilus sp.]|nr:DUF4262 domain-containing protein [Terracidiphilus sp.]
MTELNKKFATERSKYLRTAELTKTDEWAIDQIEEHGCALISVGRDCNEDFSWTYSLGIYDTCGQPELITVGLPFEVAKFCLNEAARRMCAGVDLTKERQKELISNVDCELRLVAPKWVERLMNFANWYNDGVEYPALQIIYPDLQNRFQWERSFESRFVQPLLQPGTPLTPIDHQFWDSIGTNEERFSDWKFPDKPHTKAFISKALQENKEWITYVTHDLSDGAWQILGETGIESGGPELACLHHMVEKDPTLAELADLPKGWYAERVAPGRPWERFEHEPEKVDD